MATVKWAITTPALARTGEWFPIHALTGCDVIAGYLVELHHHHADVSLEPGVVAWVHVLNGILSQLAQGIGVLLEQCGGELGVEGYPNGVGLQGPRAQRGHQHFGILQGIHRGVLDGEFECRAQPVGGAGVIQDVFLDLGGGAWVKGGTVFPRLVGLG